MGTIYVGCPACAVSGGPNLAHQMCKEVNSIGASAKMYYYGEDTLIGNWEGFEKSPYAGYGTKCAGNIKEIDQKGNSVILPETAVPLYKAFFQANVHIWWMSVDNYLYTLVGNEERLNDDMSFFTQKKVYHFVQSMYAYDFITNQLKIDKNNVKFLTDYIDEEYLEQHDETRENIVFYNWKKQGDELPILINNHPEIIWMPIKDMSKSEIIDAFHRGKVYVDFGAHPGKDRIPREAVSCGLCVIVNSQGSAAYTADVPVKDIYRFSDIIGEEDDIIKMIVHCFEDYENLKHDFDEYRDAICTERDKFHDEVVNVVDLIEGDLK